MCDPCYFVRGRTSKSTRCTWTDMFDHLELNCHAFCLLYMMQPNILKIISCLSLRLMKRFYVMFISPFRSGNFVFILIISDNENLPFWSGLFLLLSRSCLVHILMSLLFCFFQKSIYKEPQESKVGISPTEISPPFVILYCATLHPLTHFFCKMDSFVIWSIHLDIPALVGAMAQLSQSSWMSERHVLLFKDDEHLIGGGFVCKIY